MLRIIALAVLSALGLAPTPAPRTTTWAPAATATIHPGVQTFTQGGQCTANFVFQSGTNVYLGQAAHCSSTGGPTQTDGCTTNSLPLGTPVEVTGASRPGTLVYNSWITMHAVGETNPDACAYNDLALIQLDPADVGRVNPSIPHWGGPVGLNTTGTKPLKRVYSYGNSGLRGGLKLLSPKLGVSMGDNGHGWSHYVNMVTPGVPGDSGSAVLDKDGRALGVLSTVGISLPVPATNFVGDISRELNYMHSHGGPAATLATGTKAFNPAKPPLGI